MNFIKKNWKGVLLCLIIAIPSWILGKIFPIVGGPVFAILLGMVITLLVSDKSALQSRHHICVQKRSCNMLLFYLVLE